MTLIRSHSHIGTVRQLELLLEVYEAKGINQAAKNLHLTQPTVSMQLKKMADAVGMPLYDQIGKKLVFTEAGLATVESAREILDSFARLDMKLSNLRGLNAGTLRLSVVTTSKYFIPHLLGPFRQKFPDVDIQLKVGNRQQTIERLETGIDDFCVFSHSPDHLDICAIDFMTNPLIAICSSQHDLAKKKQIKLEELENYPFIIREKGSGTRYAIEQFMTRHNVNLNIKMTIESNEAIKHSVAEDLGIAILSRHTLAFDKTEGIKELNVSHMPVSTNWQLVYPSTKRLSVIAEEFLNYLNQREGLDILQNKIEGA